MSTAERAATGGSEPPDLPAATGGTRGFIGHAGWRPVLLALAIGAAGGLSFFLLRMPLAWMMGAGVACTIAAMSGARIGVPNKLRQVMLVVLGVLLGSGFSPDMLQQMPRWLVTMAVLIVATLVSGSLIYALLRRIGGYEANTAYFCAMPGGLNEMTMLGTAYGANERVIALMHAVRILAVVLTIPVWYRLMYGTMSSVFQAGSRATDLTLGDVAILIACGVVGAFTARRARMPAAMMFGPMLLSGVIHLTGVTASRPPGELVALAQVVIGSAIGCRFVGAVLRKVLRDIGYGLVSALLLIMLAVAFAWLGHKLTGLPTDDIILSYAPGGFAEMSLVGLALHADIAMVATHHLFRIFVVVMGGGLLFRTLLAPRLTRIAPPAG
ncbi:AbrB family transcriptional regulator [Vineibacter terrae]|uniref:AbrB family transcriptional regulator n=1 Tax=Vineibacter terrae TaxID=2586908 RepID=A0A5C8PPX9_9HYPH|nr:AbrB family transcriptional regulator [Vineibacter terrae]TXL76294.1 AbrB family transcriptional regulator [Vineibacter terrae]